MNKPKIQAVLPYYGCNRLLAEHVGEQLDGCKWVGIPFAGGMPEVQHIKASTIVCNDMHRQVINCAMQIADPVFGPKMIRMLKRLPFHPDILDMVQQCAKSIDRDGHLPGDVLPSDLIDFMDQQDPLVRKLEYFAIFKDDGMTYLQLFSILYFVSQWMGRSGKAGTDGEFNGKLSTRWNANGGDSNTRYRSAVKSLVAWRRILARCNFTVMDAFEFLQNCEDNYGHGIYCDPPFPGPGDLYRYKFSPQQHEQLAARLHQFRRARVVCRFYEVEAIRKLYPETAWKWIRLIGRKSTNEDAPEVLLVLNNGATATDHK